MQQKINAIFTNRVLELNDSLGFNDSLSSCNRAQGCSSCFNNVAGIFQRYDGAFVHLEYDDVVVLVLHDDDEDI